MAHLKSIYPILKGIIIWVKYVHLLKIHHWHYFCVQYVQFIIELIVLRNNVSCWNNKFLGLINWLIQRDIIIILLLKASQWISWIDGETPSFNPISKCIRINIFRSQWHYSKETEARISNISTRAAQWSYITSFLRCFFLLQEMRMENYLLEIRLLKSTSQNI